MGLGATVGADLLAVPFPQMVQSLAMAIAKGQMAMDMSSLNTLKLLAATQFDWVPEVTEVLTSRPITIPGAPAGTPPVSGVDVTLVPSPTVRLSLLQAGILPTFYQFTESVIEVKMSISSKVASQSEFEFGAELSVTAGGSFFGVVSASSTFSSHVNYKTSNTYSYSVEGSSLLRTTLRPTPPPTRVLPRFIMVNTLVSPPVVTTSD